MRKTIFFNVKKCYEFINETLDFNILLEKYYWIEGNKKENNSLIILYQTIYYKKIKGNIMNKQIFF